MLAVVGGGLVVVKSGVGLEGELVGFLQPERHLGVLLQRAGEEVGQYLVLATQPRHLHLTLSRLHSQVGDEGQ